MATVTQLINDVRLRLPSSSDTFTDAILLGWMNQAQNEIWRYCASTELYEITVVSGQSIYNMSSNMQMDAIKTVLVSGSTTIDGTEPYATYTYCCRDDELTGSQYYDSLGLIGFYPAFTTNDGGKKIKIIYEASPDVLSTDDVTASPSINSEFHDILKFRALKLMAQSGNAPDIELANNYQREEDEMLKKIRMNYYKRKQKNPRTRTSYRDGWWNG